MTNTLKSQLTFVAVPSGGTATLSHNIKLNGTDIEPDHLTFENQNFDWFASDATTLTIINNGTAAETGRVLCELWHTIERVFGDGSKNLPSKPFVDRGVDLNTGGGGAGPTNWLAFDYIGTGLETTIVTVPIPVVRPNALYQVLYTLGTVVQQFTVNLVDGTELVGSFQVNISTAPLALGDVVHFQVFNA